MNASSDLGPMVLAGSGEYTPAMDIADRYLLECIGSGEILLIATSCAQEGDDRMNWWEQMGVGHFKRLGAEATPLRIRDNDEANLREHAARIAEAALVWFSGGSPPYLAQAFENTLCFQALEAANRRGTAVAGSSGGLGVFNVHIPNLNLGAPQNSNAIGRSVRLDGTTGLGLASPVRAMAHFDRMEARRPEAVERTVAALQPGQVAVGVDEDTAVVWANGEWRVLGHKRAVVFAGEGGRSVFMPGERVDLLPAPIRTYPPVK